MSKKKKKYKKKIYFVLLIIVGILIISSHSFISKKSNDNNNEDTLKIDNTSVSSYDEDEIFNNPDYNNLDVKGKLELIATYDKRVDEIIDNYDLYPEKLLEMLTRNTDMISYMVDFPQKQGNVFSDSVGNVKKGEAPLLLQYDKRWGYGIYGDNVIAINGCGPTVLSMAISSLTGRSDVTPYTVAKYASDNGYYQSEWGTSWDIMTDGVKEFGIVGTKITLTYDNIYNELKSGHPIVCSMRPGDFTTVGHFILLTKIEDGKIRVNDPNSKKRSASLWDYDVIAPQIKGLWSFKAIEK